MIDRRTFLAGAGAVFVAALSTAEAQQVDAPIRIGFMPLGLAANAYDQSLVEAFRQGLREASLVENRQVIVDLAWVATDGGYAPAVSELVERGARVLVAAGSSAAMAAKRHTSTIPIVFVPAGNPVDVPSRS